MTWLHVSDGLAVNVDRLDGVHIEARPYNGKWVFEGLVGGCWVTFCRGLREDDARRLFDQAIGVRALTREAKHG